MPAEDENVPFYCSAEDHKAWVNDPRVFLYRALAIERGLLDPVSGFPTVDEILAAIGAKAEYEEVHQEVAPRAEEKKNSMEITVGAHKVELSNNEQCSPPRQRSFAKRLKHGKGVAIQPRFQHKEDIPKPISPKLSTPTKTQQEQTHPHEDVADRESPSPLAEKTIIDSPVNDAVSENEQIQSELRNAQNEYKGRWVVDKAKKCPGKIEESRRDATSNLKGTFDGLTVSVLWNGKESLRNVVAKANIVPLEPLSQEPFTPYPVELKRGRPLDRVYVIQEFCWGFYLIYWAGENRTDVVKKGKFTVLENTSADDSQCRTPLNRTIDTSARKSSQESLNRDVSPANSSFVSRTDRIEELSPTSDMSHNDSATSVHNSLWHALTHSKNSFRKVKSGANTYVARIVQDSGSESEECHVEFKDSSGRVISKKSIPKISLVPFDSVKPDDFCPYEVKVIGDDSGSQWYALQELTDDMVLVHSITSEKTDVFPKNSLRSLA